MAHSFTLVDGVSDPTLRLQTCDVCQPESAVLPLQAVPLGLTSLAAMGRIARHYRGRFNTVVCLCMAERNIVKATTWIYSICHM